MQTAQVSPSMFSHGSHVHVAACLGWLRVEGIGGAKPRVRKLRGGSDCLLLLFVFAQAGRGDPRREGVEGERIVLLPARCMVVCH